MAKIAKRFGNHPLEYYLTELDTPEGLTRGQVKRMDPGYYNHLRYTGRLGALPVQDIFGDPVEYYKTHYKGITRGKLSEIHQTLYHRLRNDKSLNEIPLEKVNK